MKRLDKTQVSDLCYSGSQRSHSRAKLHPRGRAYVVFPLKLLKLSFLGLVLLSKASNDLANLMMRGQFRTSRRLNF